MKKSKKTNFKKKLFYASVLLIVFLFFLFGLVAFYLKIVFTEEKIRKIAFDLVAKSVPNSKLYLPTLKISLGWDFKVKIDVLSITKNTFDKPSLVVEDLNLNLPLYTIWYQKPSISLKLKKIDFRIFEKSESSRIEKINPEEKIPPTNVDSLIQRLKIKAENYGEFLLSKSSFHLTSSEFNFLQEFPIGQPKITKCQQIDLSLKNINLPLHLKLTCSGDTGEQEPGLKGTIYLEGEATLKEFLENENLIFSGNFKLDHGRYPEIGNIPTLTGKIRHLTLNQGIITVPIEATIEKWGKGFLILTNKNGETFLNSINWKFNIESLDFLLKKLPYSKKGEFELKGKISFLKKGIYPQISLKTKNLIISSKENSVPVTIQGEILGKNYNANTQLNILKGTIKSDIQGTINWDNLSKPFGPVKIQSLVSSLDLKISKKEGSMGNPIPDIPLQAKIKFQDMTLEKIKINGNSNFSIGSNKKLKLKMNLNLNNAPLNINARVNGPNKNAEVEFDLKNFELTLLENLLPEKYGNLKGKADFNFKGTSPFPNVKTHELNFLINFSALNGEYNNPYLGAHWGDFLKENKGLEKYISKDAQPFAEFERILIQGEIDQGKINIRQFLFQSPNDKLLVHANGHLGLDEKINSLIYLDLKDKMGITLPTLKKWLGMETLYFKLVGKGLNIKPDLVYTSSKVLEKTATDLPKNLLSPIDSLIINPIKKSFGKPKTNP